ncbi:nucleoid occlusion protein [Deinococcus carri]|uniref:Nucleoid occlusion protein n=1 Tax=Deinococcus carri TaxID=1211323 RepID=A0ABP9WEC8_9DEIO
MSTLNPAVQDALCDATISEDGLTLTLAGQLDRATYQATAKAIEALGGKWNRKAKAHLFTRDVREVLAGVLDGDRLPKKNPLAFFPTPEPVVVEMFKRIWPWPNGSRFLEPSAGEGAIADLLWGKHSVYADCVELDEDRAQTIRKKGYPVVGSDFLAFTPETPYDYVLMNPPFTAEGDPQAYITHIEHALKCLRPGGELLAVVPGGFAWLTRQRVAAFREFCTKHAQSPLHEFVPGTFKASGTDIATCLIHITKPEEAAMPAPAEQPKKDRKSSKKMEVAEMSEPVVEEAAAAPVAAELPGTPTLLPEQPAPAPTVTPILDGSTSSVFRLEQLVPSPLNPRKQFEQSALEELAESIFHKGLMQNLVGRVAENGQDVEVVAGGRRLRALKVLAEQGRIPADYPVPVRVQPLTDLEALQLATAENVERRNMTPIEEADAFAQMVALGATPEDIALRFGYNLRTVQQRLVLAEGLGEDGRKLFADGTIGLGQAQVIAQSAGPLRKHVVAEAKRGGSISSLNSLIKRSSFLVEYAKFDVRASKLEVVGDLYGDSPARFADPKAALACQMDWVKARATDLEGKKEQHFVEVQVQNKDYLSASYDEYTSYDAPKELLGTVILVSSVTGEVKETRVARKSEIKSHEAKKQAQERKQAATEASGSEGGAIRKSAWTDGHMARASALRTSLLGDHKRAVALTILSMLEAAPVSLRASLSHAQATPIPAGLDRLRQIDVKVSGALAVTGEAAPKKPLGLRFGYSAEGKEAYAVLQTLLTLSLEELLDIQSVLIAQAVGGWSEYNPLHAPYEFVSRLAADTGATVAFRLTDAHLKAYPRDRLLELAADAGIEQGHGLEGEMSKLATNKDIRAAILQHADALAERGYVPPIARFPEVVGPDPVDVAYRADAKAVVLRLSDVQLDELLEDLGYDTTNEDVTASGLNLIQQEIDDMDDEELRGWEALKRLAAQLGPDQTAAD